MHHTTLLIAVCAWLYASGALAQVPTGTISGRVTDQAGSAAPGVTVTATSTNLQRARTATTTRFGDYAIPLLPPGDYTVVFELKNFRTVTQAVTVAPTQTVPLDARMALEALTETVRVVGTATPFVGTAQVATSIGQALMTALPSNRTVMAAALMAPNVKATGPGQTPGGDGSPVISGAMSYDSLYLINGVAVTENLRGQPFSLFVEDAIQETTVSTAGLSAEYGRFAGGLVNVVTKSGGNQFSGSLRVSFHNDTWRATSPFNEPKLDDTIPTYEYTVGGPILRNRLWFFNAGRFRQLQESRQTVVTNLPYTLRDEEQRYEVKLTYSPLEGQTVRGSYIKINQKVTNINFQNVMDLRSLYNQEQPQDLLSLNYNGIIGRSSAIEGQFSRRNFSALIRGGGSTDVINGTLLIDRSRGGTAFRYWAPTFCVCNDDDRDNYELLLKASYFASTGRLGAHTVVYGYDHYNDYRRANAHQSGSDFRIHGTGTVIRDAAVYPVFLPNGSTLIEWNPVALPSEGSDLRTHSLFANDTWRVNARVTLSLGLRWDINDATDPVGSRISDASRVSPRLGAVWDPFADGRWAVSASAARYASGLNRRIADVSLAGNAATYQWRYQGPAINADLAGPLVAADAAIQQVFEWFNATGGTSLQPDTATIPGVNTFIGDSLASPTALEYAMGASRTLGQRGSIRVDYLFRDYNDFYITRTDLTTGRTTSPLGAVFDVNQIQNSNDLERRYHAGTAHATYRTAGATLGATYTLSRTWGNFDGENSGSGPLTAQLYSYPEYREARWNQPDGNLAADQRHRARIWGTYRVPMPEVAGALDLGVLYSMASGVPLTSGGATASSPGTGIGQINPRPYVVNPGYENPLSTTATVEYFFFERDRFRTETQHRTDLAVNYSRPVPGGAALYFRGELLNVFNRFQLCGCGGSVFGNGGASDVRTINTGVLTASNSAALQPFNPFTETPVEGVHWRLGPTFGQPLSRFAYTTPRTFRFSAGIRF